MVVEVKALLIPPAPASTVFNNILDFLFFECFYIYLSSVLVLRFFSLVWPGTPNTGGGGGGAGGVNYFTAMNAGSGGSGIIIVKYQAGI